MKADYINTVSSWNLVLEAFFLDEKKPEIEKNFKDSENLGGWEVEVSFKVKNYLNFALK